FGTRGETLMFGLPGNPVSAFCCFELFVRPAVRKLAGFALPEPPWQSAKMADYFQHSSDRPTYHPAQVWMGEEASFVKPVKWLGPPDRRAVVGANALLRLPAGTHTFAAGQRVPVLSLDSWDAAKGMDADGHC